MGTENAKTIMNHNPESPSTVAFQTIIPVQISHINYGNHVGFDAMVSLIHEAQLRFFQSYGYTEIDINGIALVVHKLEVTYKKEIFYGENLQFDLKVGEKSRSWIDLLFKVKNANSVEVCEAKVRLVFVDPVRRKVVKPPSFLCFR